MIDKNIIKYLKSKNIHIVECDYWNDCYGYEKTQLLIDTINYIEQLQQENKELKENADNNDNVVDKVNWENQLLKKENQELKEDIKYLFNVLTYTDYDELYKVNGKNN